MSESSVPIHSPAPAPEGPIACTLHPNDFAGRLRDFSRGVFTHLRGIERPEPTRLRLVLDAAVDPGTVRDLLVREQQCCAFMTFTIAPGRGTLLADLEVPARAASALDGIVTLAELAAPGVGAAGRQSP
jgi:hypothetical protein